MIEDHTIKNHDIYVCYYVRQTLKRMKDVMINFDTIFLSYFMMSYNLFIQYIQSVQNINSKITEYEIIYQEYQKNPILFMKTNKFNPFCESNHMQTIRKIRDIQLEIRYYEKPNRENIKKLVNQCVTYIDFMFELFEYILWDINASFYTKNQSHFENIRNKINDKIKMVEMIHGYLMVLYNYSYNN